MFARMPWHGQRELGVKMYRGYSRIRGIGLSISGQLEISNKHIHNLATRISRRCDPEKRNCRTVAI